MQRAQQHVPVRHFKLLFSQCDFYQLVIRTKQWPCVGHIFDFKGKERPPVPFTPEVGVNGLAAASRIALFAVKDSVSPQEPFPHSSDKNLSVIYV